MRKWWRVGPTDPLWWWKTNAESIYDDDNVTINDDALLYCAPTGTWGKCPWETNKYDLGPSNCTGLINVYGVEAVCGKNWKKITNREKFDDRVKNGYYQKANDKMAYYTAQDDYPPMTASEELSLRSKLETGQTFNKLDYQLKPDWKHGRSKSGGAA